MPLDHKQKCHETCLPYASTNVPHRRFRGQNGLASRHHVGWDLFLVSKAVKTERNKICCGHYLVSYCCEFATSYVRTPGRRKGLGILAIIKLKTKTRTRTGRPLHISHQCTQFGDSYTSPATKVSYRQMYYLRFRVKTNTADQSRQRR